MLNANDAAADERRPTDDCIDLEMRKEMGAV
jgi:hypothetical protein